MCWQCSVGDIRKSTVQVKKPKLTKVALTTASIGLQEEKKVKDCNLSMIDETILARDKRRLYNTIQWSNTLNTLNTFHFHFREEQICPRDCDCGLCLHKEGYGAPRDFGEARHSLMRQKMRDAPS